MQGKPAETRRQTHTCRSGFLDWSRSQRTDDWCANLHPFRIGEFFEDGFKPRIRFTNAVRILNNRFAVGKETRNSKGHRDAMIAEAHYARPMQGSRTMNFEAIFHFGETIIQDADCIRESYPGFETVLEEFTNPKRMQISTPVIGSLTPAPVEKA